MKLSKITYQDWSDQLAASATALLQQHKETALFLLSYLTEYGPHRTDAIFSGDYKCLVCDSKVVAVFVLNGMGRLLLQTDKKADYSRLIIDAIAPEISRFTGLIGDWELTKQYWDMLKLRFPTLHEEVCKKEILYYNNLMSLDDFPNNKQVRFLNAHDFLEWNKLNLAFCKELNSVLFPNDQHKQARYIGETNDQRWWGLFVEQKLVSICGFTARYGDCAQIGGVYTLPEERGKGFAKQIIKQLMLDSKNTLHLKKLVLFTHENNRSAQKVYEDIGFKSDGYIGLITCSSLSK